MQRTIQLITLLFCIALLGACAQGNGLYQYTCADGQPCPSPDSGLDDKTPPPAPPAPLNAQSQPSAADASALTDASAAKSDAATNSQNFPEVTLDQNNLKDTDSLSGSGNADDDNVNEVTSLAGSSAGGSTGSTGDTSSSGGFGGLFGHGTLFGGTGGIADVIASIGGMFGGTGGIFGQSDTSNGDGSGGNGGIFSWLDGGTGGNAGGTAGLDGGLSSGGSGNADAGGDYVVVTQSEYSSGEVVMDTYPHDLKLPVTFEVPEGWEKVVRGNGDIVAWQDDYPVFPGDSISGTKLDFSFTRPGNEGEAKLLAMSAAFNSSEELRNCEPWPCKVEYTYEGDNPYYEGYSYSEELSSMSVNGITIYVHSVQGLPGSSLGYSNSFAFVKDGMLYEAMLYGDHLGNYQTALETIIETLHPVQN